MVLGGTTRRAAALGGEGCELEKPRGTASKRNEVDAALSRLAADAV